MNRTNSANNNLAETKVDKTLPKDGSGIVASVNSLVNSPSERLRYLKEISHKLIFSGVNKDKIIIPSNVLDEIHQKTGIKIHDYIQDPKFKALIIETLNLESNYGFVRYDYNSAIILINIDPPTKEGERPNRALGLSDKNINFILSQILKISDKKERIDFIYDITSKIDLQDLSNDDIALFSNSGNYIQFVFEIIKKHILMLSEGNIDVDICTGITGFIVREYFNFECDSKNIFFDKLKSIVRVPEDVNHPIVIPTSHFSGITNLQNNILNPLFKQKIIESLNLKVNYGLIYDAQKSNILMLNIAGEEEGPERRFNGLNEPKLKYILSNHLKLEHKEDIRMFLNDIISNVELNKLSQNKLTSIFESGKYIKFVFDIIAKEVFAVAKGTIDKDVSKGVTGYLFREHFDFINSRIGNLLLQKLSSSTGIKYHSIYKVDENLERKVNKTASHLKDLFNQNMKSLINDIDVTTFRKTFSNEIFIDFSNAMKKMFPSVGIKNPDKVILKGMFIALVDSGDIRNPMLDFTDLIFNKIGENNDKLAKLFGFFDSSIDQIGGEDKYPSFSFKDIEIDSSNYSVIKIFDELNLRINKLSSIQNDFIKLKGPQAEQKTFFDLNIKSINQYKSNLTQLRNEKADLENEIPRLKLNMPSGVMRRFKRQEALDEIAKKEKELETTNNEIEKLLKKISSLEKENEGLQNELNNTNSNPEFNNLKHQKELLENEMLRIKEDFANTLFYGFIR
ncbi:MAG: hypothetical protein PHG82_03920 [Candidatus Gracilibacteria bacterium]|nr:hypothetical protein [Candidatus Gracilibacteria bacterium]